MRTGIQIIEEEGIRTLYRGNLNHLRFKEFRYNF